MNHSGHDDAAYRAITGKELERFRSVRRLHNHWDRADPLRSFCWFLTPGDSPTLHTLVEHCQASINLPYYDFTRPDGLHITLDRIAFEGEVSTVQLQEIARVAKQHCQDQAAFDISVGALGGTPGAIGFAVFPVERIRCLRDSLRRSTLSVLTGAPTDQSEFRPHITIAYCNSDAPAEPAIAAVERLNGIAPVVVRVERVSLVALTRQRHSYSWREIAAMSLLADAARR